MQIIVKSTKVLKKGTNDYGEWKLVSIVTSEDVKYTTLAKDAEAITPGSTINIKDMDKDDQGRESFKKYEVIEAGQEKPKPGGGSEMTPEMWSEKDRITNASIEGQVAMKCYTELVVAKIDKIPDLLLEAIESKIKGFMGRTSTDPDVKEPSTEKPQEKMICDEQVGRIKEAAEKYKDNTEVYLKVMKDAYEMTNYKKLNYLQAEDFIKRLTAGQGLEIEPEDIPF